MYAFIQAVLLGPPILLIGSIVALVIYRPKSFDSHKWLKYSLKLGLLSTNSTYFILVLSSWYPIFCNAEGPYSPTQYVAVFPWIQCYTEDHYFLRGWGIFGLICVFMVPFGLFGLLFYYRQDRHDPDVLSVLGFLYQYYDQNIWWWSILAIIQKLLLGLTYTVLYLHNPDDKYTYSALVLIAWLILLIYLKPFLGNININLKNFGNYELPISTGNIFQIVVILRLTLVAIPLFSPWYKWISVEMKIFGFVVNVVLCGLLFLFMGMCAVDKWRKRDVSLYTQLLVNSPTDEVSTSMNDD